MPEPLDTLTFVAQGGKDIIPPVLSGSSTVLSAGMWAKDEWAQHKARGDKQKYQEALKDPIVGELLLRREVFTELLAEANVALKQMESQLTGDADHDQPVSLAIQSLNDYKAVVDGHLTEIVSNKHMLNIQGVEAKYDLAEEVLKQRMDHGLQVPAILLSTMSNLSSAVKGGMHVASMVDTTLGPAANVASIGVSAVSVPIAVGKGILGVKKTVDAVQDFRESGQTRDKAKELRAEMVDDPMLAAIAKRIQMKHEKNRVSHTLKAFGGAADTVGAAITAAGGVTTLTVGAALGAGTMGAGTVAVAVPFAVGAGAASVVSISASAGDAAYKVGRHLMSKERKQEINDALTCMNKLRTAGQTRFDAQSGEVKSALSLKNNLVKKATIELERPVPTVTLPDGQTRTLGGMEHQPVKMTNKEKLASMLTPKPMSDKTGVSRAVEQMRKAELESDAQLLEHVTGFDRQKHLDAFDKRQQVTQASVGSANLDASVSISSTELAALKKIQDHAIKHWMRAAEPMIPQLAEHLADLDRQANPGQYASKGDFKKKRDEIAKELRKQLKEEATLQYQDIDKLRSHACEVMVSRDTETAMNYLAGRLRTDCSEALLNRKMSGITSADLPNTKSVKLLRTLGVDDKKIASIATAASHENTLKTAVKTLTKKSKLS